VDLAKQHGGLKCHKMVVVFVGNFKRLNHIKIKKQWGRLKQRNGLHFDTDQLDCQALKKRKSMLKKVLARLGLKHSL